MPATLRPGAAADLVAEAVAPGVQVPEVPGAGVFRLWLDARIAGPRRLP